MLDTYGLKLGHGISAPSDQPSRSTRTSGKALRRMKAKRIEPIVTILTLPCNFFKTICNLFFRLRYQG